MSSESTYGPTPFAFPECWPQGDTIGPITDNYDGPSLTGSTIELIFSNSGQIIAGSFVFQPTVENPNRHVITFPAFEPSAPSEGNVLNYKVVIQYGPAGAPLNRRTIKAGEWELLLIP